MYYRLKVIEMSAEIETMIVGIKIVKGIETETTEIVEVNVIGTRIEIVSVWMIYQIRIRKRNWMQFENDI